MSPDAFLIKPIFREAWQTLWRMKTPFFLVAFIIILLNGADFIVQHFYGHKPYVIGFTLAFALVKLEINTGFLMMGVHSLSGQTVKASTAFAYFKKLPPLALGVIIPMIIVGPLMVVMILTTASFLFFLPHLLIWGVVGLILIFSFVSIVIFSFLLFTPLLIVENKRGPLTAWLASIKMAKPHWLRIVAITILLTLLNLLGLALLVVGMLITLPLTAIIFAKLYLLSQRDQTALIRSP